MKKGPAFLFSQFFYSQTTQIFFSRWPFKPFASTIQAFMRWNVLARGHNGRDFEATSLWTSPPSTATARWELS